jgi:hypothetical protein
MTGLTPADIVKYAQTEIPAYNKLCIAVIKSLESANNTDKKDFNKGIKRFKQLNNVVPMYLELMNNILDSFTTRTNPNNDIVTLLKYYEDEVETKDSNGKITKVKKTGYAIIDAVSQITTLIKNMVESVKALNDPKMFGLFKSMITKWNIKKMIQIIGSMVNDIITEFKGLTVDSLDLGLILGDPETITQNNNVIDKGVGEKGNSLGKNDKTITVTKKPRMGIVEAVTTIISSMLQLVQTKFGLGELIRFRINAWSFAKMWKVTFDVFLKQFKDFDFKGSRTILEELCGDGANKTGLLDKMMSVIEQIESLSVTLQSIPLKFAIEKYIQGKQNSIINMFGLVDLIMNKITELEKKGSANEDYVEGLNSTIKEYANIFGLLKGMSKNSISTNELKKILSGIRCINIIYGKIIDTAKSNNAGMVEAIQNINLTFDSFLDVCINIRKSILSLIFIKMFYKTIIAGVRIINTILNKLSEITQNIDFNTIETRLKSTLKIFGTLIIIIGSLTLTILSFIALGKVIKNLTLKDLGMILLGIGSIIAVLGVIWVLTKLIQIMKLDQSKIEFKNLAIVIGLMIVVLGVLYLMSIVADKLKGRYGLIWMAIGVITGMILIAIGILKLLEVAELGKLEIQLLLFIVVIGSLIVLIGAVYLMSIVSEKLKGRYGWIWAGLGVIIGFIVILAGLGLLMSTGIAAAMIGMGVALLLVVMGAAIAVKETLEAIASIGDIKFEETKIMNNIYKVTKLINDGYDEEKKQSGIKGLIEKVGLIGMFGAKRKLKKIKKIVNIVKKIVESLNEIQKYELKSDVVTNNLGVVYDVITSVKTENGNLGITGFFKSLDEVFQTKKMLKRTKKILKKVKKVVRVIKNIGDDLNTINDYKFTPEGITSKITNIFEVIDTIKSEIDKKLSPVATDTNERINNRLKRRYLRREKRVLKKVDKSLGKVDAVVEEIASIVENINSIKDFNVKSSVVEKKIEDIFTVINTIETQINKNLNIDSNPSDKIQYLSQLGEAISSFTLVSEDTEESTKFMGSIGTFIEKINTIDNTEIAKTRDIFKDMVKSVKDLNDNFEKLSKTMDKDIAKSLEKMNGQLEKSGGMFNTGVQTTSQTSTTSQTQPTNQSNMDNTLKAQLAQQLANDSETLGYMEEIVRLLKTNKFRVITT